MPLSSTTNRGCMVAGDIHQKLLQSSIIYDLVDLAKSRAQLVILTKLKVIAELIRHGG